MQFELLRLSMLPRAQMDGFERQKPDRTAFSREEWLRVILSENIAFYHRGEIFHYVQLKIDQTPQYIMGRIGRQLSVLENTPPESGLSETRRPSWRAAFVLIDPTHHPDGQKAAVEHVAAVARPVPLFEALVEKINQGVEPFLLEANAIVPSDTFWSFVEENRGNITTVQFEFIAPNMFGEADDYDAEMREMRERERAQKARLSLESKDGLNLIHQGSRRQ